MNEILFNKYDQKGAYHWDQISLHPLKRNAYVVARYCNVISLLKEKCGHSLKGMRILDLGCGDGVLSYLLNRNGAEVIGIDFSFEALRYARNRTGKKNINFIHGSAYSLPLEDNYFDAIVSSDVIEHVQNTELFLSEAKRVLKINGIAVISTPIRVTEKPQDKLHVFEWFPDEFKIAISKEFNEAVFFKSHPLFFVDLFKITRKFRVLINLISLFKNPFGSFANGFTYNSLQYTVAVKK